MKSFPLILVGLLGAAQAFSQGVGSQARAWDNQDGTINSWAAVIANPSVLRVASALFTPSFPLGGLTSPPTTPP